MNKSEKFSEIDGFQYMLILFISHLLITKVKKDYVIEDIPEKTILSNPIGRIIIDKKCFKVI
jgi:hypothetical protein